MHSPTPLLDAAPVWTPDSTLLPSPAIICSTDFMVCFFVLSLLWAHVYVAPTPSITYSSFRTAYALRECRKFLIPYETTMYSRVFTSSPAPVVQGGVQRQTPTFLVVVACPHASTSASLRLLMPLTIYHGFPH